MSNLNEYNDNVSLKILMDFLKDYINTDEENDDIKLAKSLIDEQDLNNINKVVNSYFKFYESYNKYYLGGQVELDIEDKITKENLTIVDNKNLNLCDCCNSTEYFRALDCISKYNDFKKLINIYNVFIKQKDSNNKN